MQKENLEEIFLENINLVKYVLKRVTYDNDYDDLYQAGCIGLLKAINNYDQTKAKFSTYAYKYIINEIKSEYRNSKLVRLPKNLYYLKRKIDPSLTISQNAKNLNVSAETIISILDEPESESYAIPEPEIDLRNLNFIEKRIVEMIYYEHKSQEEISKYLHRSQSFVSRTIKDALNKLKLEL